jgi:ADP-ribose pyrophosphatase YjhB (NUDIX family)
MTKIFQHSENSPFHISVGAVLVNDKGHILVHKTDSTNIPKELAHLLGGLDEAYILMRESLENDETLEQCVARGLREEFGAKGDLLKYLGAISTPVAARTRTFEKTTLYFLVQLTSQGPRPMDDEESFTELVWMEPGELIVAMKRQGAQAQREDLDESKIIEAYVKYK